uniref:Exonuclease domain-containing protein n=1 Tax=viral metagenome TaxID=1070528 RepID=A0A6C0I0J0_9ZZZZ
MHSMNTRLKNSRFQEKENPKYTMILDTETTGLLPNQIPDLGLITDEELKTIYPYITQISYIIYDNHEKKIVEYYNQYIKIPEHVEISEKVTELTGITREKCNNGISIVTALNNLYDAYMNCSMIVAHNMSFDSRIIKLECRRHYKKLPYLKMTKMFYNSDKNHVNILCTMVEGMTYCSLKNWPKLAILYKMLFQEDIEKYGIPLHNSLTDVLVCLRCYLKVYQKVDIDNYEFENYIRYLEL